MMSLLGHSIHYTTPHQTTQNSYHGDEYMLSVAMLTVVRETAIDEPIR